MRTPRAKCGRRRGRNIVPQLSSRLHGETPGVRETSISLIERGLAGIRDVVEAALATYRPERSQRPLTADDFDDVRLLLKPELHRRRQHLDWDIGWSGEQELPISGGPVRKAMLNLLLNASTVTPGSSGTVSSGRSLYRPASG